MDDADNLDRVQERCGELLMQASESMSVGQTDSALTLATTANTLALVAVARLLVACLNRDEEPKGKVA